MDDAGNSAPPQPTPPPPTHTTPSEPLPPGTSCCTCAYDLAGLNRDGNCPECGTSIERTLFLPLSTVARHAYVPGGVARRLRWGLLTVAAGNLAWAVAFDIALTGSTLVPLPPGVPQAVSSRGVMLLALALSTLGWRLLLKTESAGEGAFVPALSPERSRVLLMLRTLGTVLVAFLILVSPTRGWYEDARTLIAVPLALAVAGTHLLLVPLQYDLVLVRHRRLRRKAQEGPDGCLVAPVLLGLLAIGSSFEPRLPQALCLALPVVLALWLIVVHISLRRAAGQQ